MRSATYGYVGDEPVAETEELMTSGKRWKQLSGGQFFKFKTPGDTLEGVWRGTEDGRFGENGVIEVNGVPQKFSMNTALKDLVRVPKGTEVKVTYTGKQTSKSGNEFKAYEVLVEEDAEVPAEDDDSVPF